MAAGLTSPLRRLGRRAATDDGFGLVEMLIALTMLTIAIGALVTAFASSAVSLRRAGQRGTALTLADSQMEKYRTKTFTAVRIDGTLIPSSGTYVTAHLADSTIPASLVIRTPRPIRAFLSMIAFSITEFDPTPRFGSPTRVLSSRF